VEVAKRKRRFRSDGVFQIPSGELPFRDPDPIGHGGLGSTSGSADHPTFRLPGKYRHTASYNALDEGSSVDTAAQILPFHSTSIRIARSGRWAKIP